MSKALEEILTTLLGIIKLFKFVHPLNASLPIEIRLFGKVTLVKFVQFSKAFGPILVVLAGIVIWDN